MSKDGNLQARIWDYRIITGHLEGLEAVGVAAGALNHFHYMDEHNIISHKKKKTTRRNTTTGTKWTNRGQEPLYVQVSTRSTAWIATPGGVRSNSHVQP